jgi:tetratricopeptide (TPR) repeat protein
MKRFRRNPVPFGLSLGILVVFGVLAFTHESCMTRVEDTTAPTIITDQKRPANATAGQRDAHVENAPIDRESQAERDTVLAALRAETPEKAVQIYSQHIKRYPSGRGTPLMMSRLATTLMSMGHSEAAREVLQDAIALAGDDKFARMLRISMASFDIQENRLDRAENTLRQIMTLPIEGSLDSPYSVTPQLEAHRFMAQVYRKKQQFQKADQVLLDMADLAIKLLKANPQATYLSGHAAMAYALRIELIKATRPEGIEDAKKLVEEMRTRLPSWDGSARVVWGDLLSTIAQWDDEIQRRKQGGTR